jgi:vacuolar-type H+-ATPase subunit I/STV1
MHSGKPLDKEQLETLHSKRSVEKALQDVATLKAQLEEVAKQQLEGGGRSTESNENLIDQVIESEIQQFTEVMDHLTEEIENVIHVETNTEDLVQFAVSTMTDAMSAAVDHETLAAQRRAEVEDKTAKLLKALHVYQRYKDVTQKSLPDTVDFFGRTLLGLTTISGFQDTLNHSTRVLGYYLNVSSVRTIFFCVYLPLFCSVFAIFCCTPFTRR